MYKLPHVRQLIKLWRLEEELIHGQITVLCALAFICDFFALYVHPDCWKSNASAAVTSTYYPYPSSVVIMLPRCLNACTCGVGEGEGDAFTGFNYLTKY